MHATGIFDVVVVGGGPGGAVAARELARRGLRTAVVDRSAPPRYKTCGGGLVWRARQRLGLDLGPAIERETHQVEVHLLDDGLCFRVDRREPPVTMTMRAELDALLLDAARDAGAEVFAPRPVQGLEPGAELTTLLTSEGPLRSRYVVAADGAGGPTARAAGWARLPRAVAALESEVEVAAADLERFGEAARFDIGLLGTGYAWVFPKRGHLSVGCLSNRPGGLPLRRRLDLYLERLGVRCHDRTDHGFVIPVAPRARRLARDGILLVGDAAGLADPVTCEGISWAIESGFQAASAIADDFARPQAVGRGYRRRLEAVILPELRTARFLARLLYDFPRLRALLFRSAGQRLSEAFTDVYAGKRTYRSLVRAPRSYLRAASSILRGGLR